MQKIELMMFENFIILTFVSSLILLIISFIYHIIENRRSEFEIGSDIWQVSSILYSIGSFGVMISIIVSTIFDIFT